MFAKTKIALSAALVLALCGTVMASDSGENHQDGGNATGPNPYMTFSGENHRGAGSDTFAKYLVQHHVATSHVKR
jgi:hypothetical protein